MIKLLDFVGDHSGFVIVPLIHEGATEGGFSPVIQEIKKLLEYQCFGCMKIKGAFDNADGIGGVEKRTFLVIKDPQLDGVMKLAFQLGKEFAFDVFFYRQGEGDAELVASRPCIWMGDTGARKLLGKFNPDRICDYFGEMTNRKGFVLQEASTLVPWRSAKSVSEAMAKGFRRSAFLRDGRNINYVGAFPPGVVDS